MLDIIAAGESLQVDDVHASRMPQRTTCSRCGYMASGALCKACVLLETLNKGRAQRMLRTDEEEAVRAPAASATPADAPAARAHARSLSAAARRPASWSAPCHLHPRLVMMADPTAHGATLARNHHCVCVYVCVCVCV